MQNAEVELKFPVNDPVRLQTQLPALGFHLDTPRTFERNTLYDTPERTLRGSGQILRLRQYGEIWTVTHKRRPSGATPGDGHYKVRIETETRVEDGPALEAIFEQLGYGPVFQYEKFRTEWSQAATSVDGPLFVGELDRRLFVPEPTGHLVIDETAIGNFAELEGPPAWIDTTIEQLGIDRATCITDSYGKLFLDWKKRTGSAAEHLTFEQIAAAVQELAAVAR